VFCGSGAVVAQLLPKQWVAGSNPVSRSNPIFLGFSVSRICVPHGYFNVSMGSSFFLPSCANSSSPKGHAPIEGQFATRG
jgi:hypothetical protein